MFPECTRPQNLVLLVDGNVESRYQDDVRSFCSSLVAEYNVRRSGTHVALAMYGNEESGRWDYDRVCNPWQLKKSHNVGT